MQFDRDLIRSVVEPIVLRLTSERAMYGYEIIKVVNQQTDGAFEWKEGTLYPCLHRLETARLIESHWEEGETGRRRKYYSITRKGQSILEDKVDEWKAFTVAVGAVLLVPKGARA